METYLRPDDAAVEAAPPDWYYHSFPLTAGGGELVCVDELVLSAGRLLDDEPGDRGQVLHWAHLLKVVQAADGSWPAQVNARTGEEIGAARTRSPAVLLARLDSELDSTEFSAAVALARLN